MAARVIIAAPDWSDEADITATNEDPEFPVTNLQTMQPGDVWQTEDLTSIQIDLDRGSAKPFNMVALLFCNATAAATWRIRASATTGFVGTTGDVDTGNITLLASPTLTTPVRRHGFRVFAAADVIGGSYTPNMGFGVEGHTLAGAGGLSFRYMRINITDAANPDTWFNAGRVYVSQAYQPTEINYQYGNQPFGFNDPSPVTELVGGPRIPRCGGAPRPTAAFALSFLSETEAYRNLVAMQERGSTHDHLVILNPEESVFAERKMIYGLFQARQGVQNPYFDQFENQFQIEGLV